MRHPESKDEQPLNYALRFTERARRDIDAETVYIAETSSPEIAIVWREGLYDTVASLAILPRRCPLAREQFRCEVRQILYRRPGSRFAHRILFTFSGEEAVSSDAPTVILLHVRHSASRPLTKLQARAIESQT